MASNMSVSANERYIASVSKWKCDDLRDELLANQLSTVGPKPELILRLQEFLREQLMPTAAPDQPSNETQADDQTNQPTSAQVRGDNTALTIDTTPVRSAIQRGDNPDLEDILINQNNSHDVISPNVSSTVNTQQVMSQVPIYTCTAPPSVQWNPTQQVYSSQGVTNNLVTQGVNSPIPSSSMGHSYLASFNGYGPSSIYAGAGNHSSAPRMHLGVPNMPPTSGYHNIDYRLPHNHNSLIGGGPSIYPPVHPNHGQVPGIFGHSQSFHPMANNGQGVIPSLTPIAPSNLPYPLMSGAPANYVQSTFTSPYNNSMMHLQNAYPPHSATTTGGHNNQPLMPNLASTHIDPQDSAVTTYQLALDAELKALKTQDEIRSLRHRLTLPPENPIPPTHTYNESQSQLAELNQSMLQLVKQSVDISSLPPAKPFIFSGDRMNYLKWKSVFDLLVESKDLQSCQKLIYLEQYVSGEALNCIQGYTALNTADAYTEARAYLDERYGDPYDIADAYRDRLESWPKIPDTDAKGLRKYADFLKQCLVAMKSVVELSKLNDPRELKCFPNALPSYLIKKWSRFAGNVRCDQKRHATFQEYCDFVKKEAWLANDNTTSLPAITGASKNADKKVDGKRSAVALSTKLEDQRPQSSVSTASSKLSAAIVCHMCKTIDYHNTADCDKLLDMTYDKLQDFIKQSNLCFLCLRRGHGQSTCHYIIQCKSCNGKHASCFHKHKTKSYSGNSIVSEHTDDNNSSCENADVYTVDSTKCEGLTTSILPVYVSSLENPNYELMVYALVDSGSNTSLLTKDISSLLSPVSESTKLDLSTVTAQGQTINSNKIVNLRIRGIRSDQPIHIPETFTVNSLPANRDHIPTPDTAAKWSHLQHLQSRISPLQPCDIASIIGYNCSAASYTFQEVKGNMTEPFAKETVLGWSIVGGLSVGGQHLTISHRIEAKELTTDEILSCLQEDLDDHHDGLAMSQNDLLFLDKMKGNIKQVNGFYTMPLPFKDLPSLPNNRPSAMERFHLLERRFKADQPFQDKYVEFMEDIVSKGEAEICASTGKEDWFIPHFGVVNHRKPDKLRVVFDCSATYQGHSLNKHLLQGPDLNNNLAGLLARFRRNRIAVMCDIKKMFHQFRVSEKDRKYLKFIWYKKETSDPVDYQMNVHLFGAVSSPSCAIFGLKQLAQDNSKQYPKVNDFIQENFYVDDGLISLPTPQDAIDLMQEAKTVMAKGNLVLHKFLSNDPEVANALDCQGPNSKAISADPNINRALGLCWNIDLDHFTFSDQISSKPSTRRGLLSTVASVFDPLGFLAPFTLKGKLLIQDICRDNKAWDDPLSTAQLDRWKEWLEHLEAVKSFKVDRCFLRPDISTEYSVELHTFSDASTYAYGACAYVRIVDELGHAAVSLALGKSRVAPKKPVTIPRLELQAATLAAKIADFLKRELKYSKMPLFFWSDSETVLGYISSDVRKFKTFVCNRVQRIRDTSSPEQWRYISTTQNPADIASRGAFISQLPDVWLHGPKFLSDPALRLEDKAKHEFPLNPEDPEIKKVFSHSVQSGDKLEFIHRFGYVKSWEKLARLVSTCMKVCSKQEKEPLYPQSRPVFLAILRMIQKAYFSDSFIRLGRGQTVGKDSGLAKLDPFVDKEGILRVGGRLKDALCSYDVKHPAVMPGQSHITKLYAQFKHIEAAHQGKATTLNHIRASGVYIVGQGSRLVASLVHKCLACIRLRGKMMGQKMADLPPTRTEPSAPFTHTGMDVFGPFFCRDGRKDSKRYGLVFTCLSSRAVHLELLDDMTTDCFINSLRCFIALRGPVHSLLSDNGTNFVGADNEMLKARQEMFSDKTTSFLHSKHCIFKFNSPTASHMGGSWERMIRTVRNVLSGLLTKNHTTRLDTSSLRTLLYECMAIINSRPLTTQHVDQGGTVEPVPLTPNMLLTMKEEPYGPPPGDFQQADLYSRKRWRRIQFLAEQFWSRWKLEYLQNLQARQKWNTKQRTVQAGDVVLIADTDLPRATWKMAAVIEPIMSGDGLVRRAKLRLSNQTELERPVHKLVLLVPAAVINSEKN